VLNAHIPTDYKSMPGNKYPVQVFITSSEPEARIDTLTFTLRYKHGMMRDEIDATSQQSMDQVVAGTILNGWKVSMPFPQAVDTQDTTVTVLALNLKAPAGQFLTGTGVALNIPFVTYIGNVTESPLPFFLTPTERLECADIVTVPGKAVLDSVCGLNFRLISAFAGAPTYALQQNNPNPFNPTTDINFSLGLDGETKVSIYDANGKQVAVLVDTYLKPGKYAVTWDASAMPSGLYYCRIVSGHWSKTQTMMLQK
jgi:hypothetical protein